MRERRPAMGWTINAFVRLSRAVLPKFWLEGRSEW
jgi:hypothetical protein